MANRAQDWRQEQRERYWDDSLTFSDVGLPIDPENPAMGTWNVNGFADCDGEEVNPGTGECNPFCGDVASLIDHMWESPADEVSAYSRRQRRGVCGPVELVFGGVYGGPADYVKPADVLIR